MRTESGFQATRDQDPVAAACLQLWAEVLHIAFDDARGKARRFSFGAAPDESPSHLQVSARWWIASDERGPGSFLWICDLLELNPEVVRTRLARAELAA